MWYPPLPFSILAANQSAFISRFIYSSDSSLYLDKAKLTIDNLSHSSVDFYLHERSSKNSMDSSSSWDAVNEIDTFNLHDTDDGIILISATCPTISSSDIDLFCSEIKDSVSALSVRLIDYPIENTFYSSAGFFQAHQSTCFLSARQHSTPTYRPDGHLYFRSYSNFTCPFPDNLTKLIDLRKSFYSNIDSLQDYNFARFTLENL